MNRAAREPDPIFAHPRLAEIYDVLDGPRADLDSYEALVRELGARHVIDIGCGTGTFCCQLAAQGLSLVGVDPAAASIEVARRKPYADSVQWIVGDVHGLPALAADMAVMTGNVAQVFLGDDEWQAALGALRRSLRPGGWLAFEVRDPAAQGWRAWTRAKTYRHYNVAGIGMFEAWCDVTDVDGELVTFRWTFVFTVDGVRLVSDSTLRFRSRTAIEASLAQAGFAIEDVRDAPDRPGQELVFIARREG